MKNFLTALLLGTVSILAAPPAYAKNNLPPPGRTVEIEEALEICRAQGWDELRKKIEAQPPLRPFVVGSCADWSERWQELGLYEAWFHHGLEYWAGTTADQLGRLKADTALMLAVADATQSPEAGIALFNRVRVSGSPFQSTHAFAWGFGRRQANLPDPTCGERLVAKLRPVEMPRFVRPYEPTQLGITKDEHDETFMDFQLSVMFPIYGGYPEELPPELTPDFRFGDFDFRRPQFFASATLRAGQYIETRPSSPVIGKRFNPQLFTRFWARDQSGVTSSPGKYLDLIFFGHESNGQAIGTLEDFLAQKEVYRRLEKQPETENAALNATRWAHDSISRGWDYVGAEVGWSWRANFPATAGRQSVQVENSLRVKVRHFLPWGLAQKSAEQYRSWEGDGPSHPRRNYDGFMVQYTTLNKVLDKVPLFTGRGTLTYTTGLSHPFKYNTIEADLGFKINALPLSIWGRFGYNSDLADYYRPESGYGFRISLWEY